MVTPMYVPQGTVMPEGGRRMQRLDRFLSEAGVASRRELRAIIRAGRVRVNDVPASAPEQKIDETSDRITLDGEAVAARAGRSAAA